MINNKPLRSVDKIQPNARSLYFKEIKKKKQNKNKNKIKTFKIKNTDTYNYDLKFTFGIPWYIRPEPIPDLAVPASPYVIHLYLEGWNINANDKEKLQINKTLELHFR